MEKLVYSDLVEMLARRVNQSDYKTNLFTKEYTKVLQDALSEGKDVEILGICKLYLNYKNSDCIIYNNDCLGYAEQLKELDDRLGWGEVLISKMLRDYLRLIKQKIEQGYKLNIKSILYIEPNLNKEENNEYYDTRCNPNIELPYKKYFMVLFNDGNKKLVEIDNNKLSLRVDLDENLKSPKDLKEKVKLNHIDI